MIEVKNCRRRGAINSFPGLLISHCCGHGAFLPTEYQQGPSNHLLSGIGGNFDKYVRQHVNGEKVAAWKSTHKWLVDQIAEIPTTTRNQTE